MIFATFVTVMMLEPLGGVDDSVVAPSRHIRHPDNWPPEL